MTEMQAERSSNASNMPEQRVQGKGVVVEPSLKWRVAHKLGLASLAASIGIFGATATGHGGPVEVSKNAVTGVADVAQDAGAAVAAGGKERLVALKNDWVNGTPDPRDPRNK